MAPRNGGVTNEAMISVRTVPRNGMSVRATSQAIGAATRQQTNPTLVAKEGDIDFKERIAAICAIVKGDISAEVTALDTEGMLKEGRELARPHHFGDETGHPGEGEQDQREES